LSTFKYRIGKEVEVAGVDYEAGKAAPQIFFLLADKPHKYLLWPHNLEKNIGDVVLSWVLNKKGP